MKFRTNLGTFPVPFMIQNVLIQLNSNCTRIGVMPNLVFSETSCVVTFQGSLACGGEGGCGWLLSPTLGPSHKQQILIDSRTLHNSMGEEERKEASSLDRPC